MALTVSKRGRVNEGRPTAYRPEYARQCFHLCKLGAIDQALGLFFGVSERTINTWKHEHPDFLAAMKRGKAFADAQVAVALYNCAIGFEHPAEKLLPTRRREASSVSPTPNVIHRMCKRASSGSQTGIRTCGGSEPHCQRGSNARMEFSDTIK